MKKRAEELSRTSRLAITVVVVVMALLFILLVVIVTMQNERVEAERGRLQDIAADAAVRVRSVMASRMKAVQGLSTIISEDKGKLDRFSASATLLAMDQDVVAVYAAPRGVVSAAYPPGETFRGIGDSILTGDGGREAKITIDQRRPMLAGPFATTDGDAVLQYSCPVSIDEETWGAVVIEVLFSGLMEKTFLGGTENHGFTARLMGDIDGKSQAIWSLQGVPTKDSARERIAVYNINWDLVVYRLYDRMDEVRTWLYIIGLILLCLLVLTLYNFYRNLRYVKTLMENMAMTDGLTGLPNRRATLNALNAAVDNATRTGGAFVLLYMDLNGFKMVNDTHGHEKGDRVLIKTAEILRENVRDRGHIGRVGGDEFVFIFDDISEGSKLDRIIEVLEKRLRMVVAGAPHESTVAVSVSASFGAAFFPKDGKDAPSLLAKADVRMYETKRRMKGTIRMGPYKPNFR